MFRNMNRNIFFDISTEWGKESKFEDLIRENLKSIDISPKNMKRARDLLKHNLIKIYLIYFILTFFF